MAIGLEMGFGAAVSVRLTKLARLCGVSDCRPLMNGVRTVGLGKNRLTFRPPPTGLMPRRAGRIGPIGLVLRSGRYPRFSSSMLTDDHCDKVMRLFSICSPKPSTVQEPNRCPLCNSTKLILNLHLLDKTKPVGLAADGRFTTTSIALRTRREGTR